MKTCTRCKQTKPLLEFYKDNRNKDGHISECKACFLKRIKKYSQTEQGRGVHHRANSKYEKSKKGKVVQRRKYLRHPEVRKARALVNEAVRNGLIPNAKSLQCNYCPNQAQEYHHYKGYAPEHWLNILPTCINCHRKVA